MPFIKQKVERPHYQGDLPVGNNGLGLKLLGVTGDQVYLDVYNDIKARTLSQVRGTVQADILKKTRHKTLVFSLLNLPCV
jgi:methylmalonyl-CoA mutase